MKSKYVFRLAHYSSYEKAPKFKKCSLYEYLIPTAPLKQRRSLPRTSREIDPLFGIPIVTSPKRRQDTLGKTKPPSGGSQGILSTHVTNQKRQDVISNQKWRPYSPYYIGMQGYQKPNGNPNQSFSQFFSPAI